MHDDQQPDLTGEQARERQAAARGIQARAALVAVDRDDDELESAADVADGAAEDDDEIQDPDAPENATEA